MDFSIRSYCLLATERVFNSPVGQVVIPHSEKCAKLTKSGLSFKRITSYLAKYKYDTVDEWISDVLKHVQELKRLLGADSKFGIALDTLFVILNEDLQEVNLCNKCVQRNQKEESKVIFNNLNDCIINAPNTRKELINTIGVAVPRMKPQYLIPKQLYYDNDDITEIRNYVLDDDDDTPNKKRMMEIIRKFEKKKHVVGQSTFTFNFAKLSPYTIHLLKKYITSTEN